MLTETSFAPPSAETANAAARDRLRRLRASLKKHELAAVLLFDSINLRYACNSRNMQVNTARNPGRYVFVPAEGPVVLFEYYGCGHLSAGLDTVHEVRPAHALHPLYSETKYQTHLKNFAHEIVALLKAHGNGNMRLGIDRPTTEMVGALQALAVEVSDAEVPLDKARAIKSPNELELIRASVRCTEAAVSEMERYIEPGRSENEVWSKMHQKLIEGGGEYIETRLFNSGSHTNPWFQETSDKPLREGELVALDTDAIGCFGYYTDFSRTFLCGDVTPTAEQRKIYGYAYEMLEHNIALLGAGVGFREFAEKSWPIPEAYIPNRYMVLAHGNGMAGEWPLIRHMVDWDEIGEDGVLEPNMTICVEAFIGHEKGGEGVKLEEQVLIKEDGIERLSTYGYEPRLMPI
ncbi:Xaa-Pro peptidase family protein [Roseibium sp. HPY-6]|uniref:M24 family metallopeptidase n=1 Tax=Roseibium sp. HPY-6 TaxID=3229852 RepID=UPI00338F2564